MSYRSELIQVAAVALAAVQNLDAGSTKIGIGGVNPSYLGWQVHQERLNQEEKWGPQNHSPEKWMVILMEEVGEAAEAVLEDDLP